MVQSTVFDRVDSDIKLRRTITNSRATEAPITEDEVAADEQRIPLLMDDREVESDPLAKRVTWVVRLSLVVNFLLLGAKLYAFLLTHSRAVLASLSDSFVDIACQGIIFYADSARNSPHPMYPVGRARFESIGVILCSVTMSLASAAVIEFSIADLIAGFRGTPPELDIDLAMYVLLGLAVGAKVGLYAVCAALAKVSDVANALAVDHRNDVVSNSVALAAAALAANFGSRLWWADAAGAVVVSLYIIYAWMGLAGEQIARMVGLSAPEEFIEGIEALGMQQHEGMRVDRVRAYHFGARYIVEMEVVLPGIMTLQESHDLAAELQKKVEDLEDVERAFVLVDYRTRMQPRHKGDWQLFNSTQNNKPEGNSV